MNRPGSCPYCRPRPGRNRHRAMAAASYGACAGCSAISGTPLSFSRLAALSRCAPGAGLSARVQGHAIARRVCARHRAHISDAKPETFIESTGRSADRNKPSPIALALHRYTDKVGEGAGGKPKTSVARARRPTIVRSDARFRPSRWGRDNTNRCHATSPWSDALLVVGQLLRRRGEDSPGSRPDTTLLNRGHAVRSIDATQPDTLVNTAVRTLNDQADHHHRSL